MAIIFEDTFNVGAETLLESHTPDTGNGWAVLYSSLSAANIYAKSPTDTAAAHAAAPDTSDNGRGKALKIDPAPAVTDVAIEFAVWESDWGRANSYNRGAFARDTGGDTHYAISIVANGNSSDSLRLWRTEAGSSTLIGSYDETLADNMVIRFECFDAAKKVFAGGVERISVSDNVISGAGDTGLFWGNWDGMNGGGHPDRRSEISDYSVEEMGGPAGEIVPVDRLALVSAAETAGINNAGGSFTVTLSRLTLAATAQNSLISNAGGQSVIPVDRLSLNSNAHNTAPWATTDQTIALDTLSLALQPRRLPASKVTPTFRVYVDWDNDGLFGLPDADITPYVKEIQISLGNQDANSDVAAVGQCELTLDNSDRHFTPANTSSPFYGRLRPHLTVKVEAEMDIWPQPIRLFTGRIRQVSPGALRYGDRLATILCEDFLGTLQGHDRLSIPVQTNKSPDYVAGMVIAEAFGGARRTYDLNVSNIISGTGLTVADKTYTFTATPSTANQVKLGGTPFESIDNLAAAINGGDGVGVVYGSGTIKNNYYALVKGQRQTIQTSAAKPSSTNLPVVGGGGQFMAAQSFVMPFRGQVGAIRVWVVQGNPGAGLSCLLRNDNGSNAPGDTTYKALTINGVGNEQWAVFDLSSSSVFEAGTRLWILFQSAAAAPNDFRLLAVDDSYSEGQCKTWDSLTPSVWYSPFGVRDLRIEIPLYQRPQLQALVPGAWSGVYPGNNVASAGLSGISPVLVTFGSQGVAQSLEADRHTFDVTGGEWRAGETNAMSAIQELCASSGGMFWVSRTGVPTYKTLDWQFKLPTQASKMIIDNAAQGLAGGMAADEIANVVTATAFNRRKIVNDVIAEAPDIIAVPGRWGSEPVERWTANAPTDPGSVTVRLPFANSDTGKYVAALRIDYPTAGTDFTVSDREGSDGYNYTNDGLIKFSFVPVGGELEVTVSNAALGTLYVKGLRFRGQRFTDTSEMTITRRDENSIALYGERTPLRLEIPFTVSYEFTEGLVKHTLTKSATPKNRARTVYFDNPIPIGGRSVYEIEIGDLITLADEQAGIAERFLVTGVGYQIMAGQGVDTVQLAVREISPDTYWLLGNSSYGKLGDNTRLGV